MRRAFLWAILFCLPLGCCVTSYLALDPPWKNAKVERLQADANARVPVGSTRCQVEEWFASHNISCGQISEVESKRMVGYMGEISDNAGLETASIYIEFYFNEQERVSRVSIRRFVVSL